MAGSMLIALGFPALSALMIVAVGLLIAGPTDRRTGALYVVGGLIWASVTTALAAAGVLDRFSLPPPILLVFAVGVVLLVVVSRSRLGEALVSLPVAWLIGLQGFRVFVELLIHQAVVEGVAPPQMTWTGLNFDVVAGATAPLVAVAVSRGIAVKPLVIVWNLVALGLLGTVVIVGVLSMPTPLQVLRPDNTWIVHPPYVLLPAVLVLTALLLHVAALRKAMRSGRAPTGLERRTP